MSALKLTAGIVIALILVVVLAVVALLFVDPSAFRGVLQTQASAALGRPVQISGPIGLEPSLQPDIVLHDLTIGNVEWASEPHFATIRKTSVKAELLPLLLGRLNIVQVLVSGVDLNLETNSDGITNFEFGQKAEPGERDESSNIPSIQQILIEDVSIQLRSQAAEVSHYRITRGHMTNIPGEPAQIEINGSFRDIEISAMASAAADATPSVFEHPWSVSAEAHGEDLFLAADGIIQNPGNLEQARFNLKLNGENKDSLEKLAGVELPATGPFSLSADVRIESDYVEVIHIAAQIPVFENRSGIEIMAGSATGGADVPVFIDLEGEIGGAPMRLKLETGSVSDLAASGAVWPLAVQMYLADADLRLQGTVSPGATNPEFDLDAELAGGDLNALGSILGVELPQTSGYQLSLGASGAGRTYRLSDLQGTVSGIAPWQKIGILNGEMAVGLSDRVSAELQGMLDNARFTATLEAVPRTTLEQNREWQMTLESVLADTMLTASGVLSPSDKGKIRLDVNLKGDTLETLGSVSGVTLPDVGSYEVSADVTRDAESVDIRNLSATFGIGDLAGHLIWSDKAQRPRLSGKLASESIAIPRFASETQAEEPLDVAIDLDWLNGLDVDITADVGRLHGQPFAIEQVEFQAAISEGQLTTPFSARAEGIPVKGRIELASSETGPKFSLRAEAARVDLEKFLDLMGISAQASVGITGNASAIEVEASGQGQTVRALLEGTAGHLKAKGELRYTDKVFNKTVRVESAHVSVTGGGPLKLRAEGTLDESPLSFTAETATVARLLAAGGTWPLNARFETSAIRLQTQGSVASPLEGKGFELAVEAQGEDVTKLDPLMDFVFPFKGKFLFKGQLSDDRQGGYTLDQFKARIGDSEISGNISVTINGPRPELIARLAAQVIDFDNLYFLAADDSPGRDGYYVVPDYAIPTDALKSADVDLEFRAERIRAGEHELGDLQFSINLEDGRFLMSPFTVRHSSGTRVDGEFLLDAGTYPPRLELQFNAKDLDYGRLLNHWAVTDLMAGQVDIHMELSGSGTTRRDLISQADGRLVVIGGEGKIRTRLIELWAAGLITTMLSPQWHREPVTDLKCIALHVDMEKGKAQINDLLFDTRRVTVAGAGMLYFGTEELDILIAPRPKNPSLVSLANPVEIAGTLANPDVRVRRIPRRGRLLGTGLGVLAGLVNPLFLLAAFADTGTGYANPCESATERVSSQVTPDLD